MSIPYIIFNFPNHTTAEIKGDPEVIKQIVDRLDGVVIKYTTPSKDGYNQAICFCSISDKEYLQTLTSSQDM